MFPKSKNAIFEGDPVLRVLYDVIFKKFGPIKSSIVLGAIPIGLCLLAGYIEGTLFNTEDMIGVLKDYTLYVLVPVSVFSIFLFYKFSVFVKKFIDSEIEERIDEKKLGNDIEKLDDKLAKALLPRGGFRVMKIILLVVFIVFWIHNLINGFDPVTHYGKDIWVSYNHPLGFAIAKLFNLVCPTILLAILCYHFMACLLGFSWLFYKVSKKNAFIIRPLFPDNCGGLKILSNLSMYFTYMLLPFFLMYISMTLRGSNLLTGQQISLLTLVIFLFVAFFLPLSGVHRAMKAAKNQESMYISRHFTILNEEIKAKMPRKKYDDEFIADCAALKEFDFLYGRIKKMPVWPFNFSSIGKLISAASIPLIFFIVEQLQNPNSLLNKIEFIKDLVK